MVRPEWSILEGMTTQAIEIAGHRIWADGDGILHVKTEEARDVDLGVAMALVGELVTMAGSVKRALFCDLRRVKSMDRDARNYFAGPATASWQVASALLVDSPLTRAIGNFFMGLNKPLVPTRLFTNEQEAKSWLKTFC